MNFTFFLSVMSFVISLSNIIITSSKKFPIFTFGKCLLYQTDLITSDPMNNPWYQYRTLPILHQPNCILNNSPQPKNKKVQFASVGIIQDVNDKVLLTRRSKVLSSFPQSWVFPGGKIDKNEHFSKAWWREIQEETGIKIIHRFNQWTGHEYYYNDNLITIEPILMYESLYPGGVWDPRNQALVIYFIIKFPISSEEISLHMSIDEVDAFVWVHLDTIFNMVFNCQYQSSIMGYEFNKWTGEYEKCVWTEDNFRPPYKDNSSHLLDITSKKQEYIPHGHRSSIKMLYFWKDSQPIRK